MTISLITATIPNLDAAPKDEVKFGLVIEGGAPLSAPTLQGLWDGFLNVGDVSHHALGELLAGCVSRAANAVQCAAYDITTHLDGSPHGSPYVTAALTLTGALSDSRGNAQCLVLTMTDSAYPTEPVNGPMGAIPTPEQAQDYGAPATHTGVTKLRARHANRVYLGPIAGDTIGIDGDGNAVFTSTTVADAVFDLGAFNAFVTAVGQGWRIWSRRDAAVHTVAGGWVDHGIKIRRHKNFIPNARTTW